MALPTLVVVSGPAGTGKTRLAHALANAIGCPAVCRDEIKEGMAHGLERFEPAPGDALTVRTLALFFGAVRLLLEGGVTVVAEAAFQHKIWAPNLDVFGHLAQLRIVQCHADAAIARQRMLDRLGSRRAHADSSVLDDPGYFDQFARVQIDAPSIAVDTTAGYDPSIDEIVSFIRHPG